MSLQTYMVAVILLASAPIALMLTRQVWTDVRAAETRTELGLAQSTATLGDAVQRELGASFDALDALALGGALRQLGAAGLGTLLDSRPALRRQWSGMFVADAGGRVFADTTPGQTPSNDDAVAPALARAVIEHRESLVSDLDSSGNWVLLAVPVMEGGTVRYVMGARLNAKSWQGILDASPRPPNGGFVSLIDGRGRVLARTGSAQVDVGAEPAGMQRLVQTDGSVALMAWQPMRNGRWRVGSGVSLEPIDRIARNAVVSALTTTGASLLLGILLALVLAWRVTQPLKELATRGASAVLGRQAVSEIGVLRDALQQAAVHDRLATRLLQSKADEFETLFHSNPTGLAFASDASCRNVRRNAAMERLFGGDEQLVGTVEVFNDGQRLEPGQQPLQRACLRGETVLGMEIEVRTSGEANRFIIANAVPLRDAEGRPRGAISAVTDITELKQMQSRLQDAHEALRNQQDQIQAARLQAEDASRAKDELLTMLGHELRNPLGAIAAAAEVLTIGAGGPETAVQALDIVLRQSRHMTLMMNELLDVSRTVSGRLRLSRKVINLADLTARVKATVEITAEARRHPIKAVLTDVWVDADPTRIEQVLANLLSNAFRHTTPGGEITVRVGPSQGQALLSVADSGPGIAPALLGDIFELFTQGARTLDRPKGGLGIGLTLARSIVEQHGGGISVDSAASGTIFTVRLPSTAPPKNLEAMPNRLTPTRRGAPQQVLVIEDIDDVRVAMVAMLEIDGHLVWAESDGYRGLQTLLRDRPQTTLVDIGLPGLDGFQVARRARGQGHPGRMVAMSGYGQAGTHRDALRAGFDAFLVKPITLEQLRAALQDADGPPRPGADSTTP